MSKSLLAAVLLPLVACSAKNAKPEYAIVPPTPENPTEDVGVYEPDEGTTTAAGVTTDGAVSDEVTAQAERTFAVQMTAHHESGIQLAKLAQQRAEHQELKDLATNMITKQEAQLSELKMLTSTAPDLGSDDGLQDLHGQLNTTRAPAPSEDVTAMHDGVEPPTPDGVEAPPVEDDKTASTDDAAATGEPATGYETAATAPATEVPASGPNAPEDDLTAAQDDETAVPKDLEALASAEDFDKAFLDAMIQHHEKGIALARAVSPRLEGDAKQLADAIVATQSEDVAKMKGWQQAWFQTDTVTSM